MFSHDFWRSFMWVDSICRTDYGLLLGGYMASSTAFAPTRRKRLFHALLRKTHYMDKTQRGGNCHIHIGACARRRTSSFG